MTTVLTDESIDVLAHSIDVEIVVPVYNEAAGIDASITRLHRYLTDRFPFTWQITIADNASTDATWEHATELVTTLAGVRAVHLDRKGRGLALRAVWTASAARVVTYMDVDLSTDLDALLPLVAPLLSGHSDLAIGSRLASGASVVRGTKRELISRTYNLILKATLHNQFSDAQCGFKAVRAEVARALLPAVEDDAWFFDTELLVLAERNGFRIHEVPVDWTDDVDSRVHITSTALEDLKGVCRLLRSFAAGGGTVALASGRRERALPGQLARFAGVGLASTVLFALLFVSLAPVLGVLGGDVVALAIASIANTMANRRITFRAVGRERRLRHYAIGTAIGLLPLVLTLAVLVPLAGAELGAQLVALTFANAAATLLRFVLLRRVVFGAER